MEEEAKSKSKKNHKKIKMKKTSGLTAEQLKLKQGGGRSKRERVA